VERFAVPEVLAEEMCDRLGVAVPTSMAGVGDLYRAWSAAVPFDCLNKALARREGTLPPGGDPVAFCETWLATSLGGTCWGHVSAMGAVLQAGGINCRVGLDHLLDTDEVDFHAFLVVEDGDRRWMVDVIHGSGEPLLLEAGSVGVHPAYPARIDADEGRLLHRYTTMYDGRADVRRYAIVSTDVDAAGLRTFCEVSRHFGMTARSIYSRRFTATEMIDGRPNEDGSALVVRHLGADGPSTEEYRDPDEAFAALGYGPEAAAMAERAGLIEHSGSGIVRFVPRVPK